MEKNTALPIFEALSSGIRLDVFRLRVKGDAETGRHLEHEVAHRNRLCRRCQQAVEHR